jgi:mevalonate kinase
MKSVIPAKTFLLGEYVAISGGPALVLTTSPCFEVACLVEHHLQGIHPDSPAGLWWQAHADVLPGFSWVDPYDGLGGMGASSAQFLGLFQLAHQTLSKAYSLETLLSAYHRYAWSGQGLAPSGYDVIAQQSAGCVYIHSKTGHYQSNPWPFRYLGFVLLHTGHKLATHSYLLTSSMPDDIEELAAIVHEGQAAIETLDDARMIDAVNAYHSALLARNRLTAHSRRQLMELAQEQDVLACKGCGAMGADILLLLVAKDKRSALVRHLQQSQWRVLATDEQLYSHLRHP